MEGVLMENFTIRKVENGFVIVIDGYEDARREYVAANVRDVIDLVTEHFFGSVRGADGLDEKPKQVESAAPEIEPISALGVWIEESGDITPEWYSQLGVPVDGEVPASDANGAADADPA